MGHKILLADDSITIQKVIELTFSDEDFELHTVGNGQKAIDEIRSIRPDIVLCDIIMPEKNGYEVCEFIKSNDDLKQIPVLLLTGAFEPFDQERAKAAGCEGFLAKPFEPQTLIAKVKELLAGATGGVAQAAAPPVQPPAPVPPPPPAAPPPSAAPPPAPPPSAASPPAPPPSAAPPPAPEPDFAGVPIEDETVLVQPPSLAAPPPVEGPQIPVAPVPPPIEPPPNEGNEAFAVEAGERELAMDPGDQTMLLAAPDVPAAPSAPPTSGDDIWSEMPETPETPAAPVPMVPESPAVDEDAQAATVFMSPPLVSEPSDAGRGATIEEELNPIEAEDPDATWQVPSEKPPAAPPVKVDGDFEAVSSAPSGFEAPSSTDALPPAESPKIAIPMEAPPAADAFSPPTGDDVAEPIPTIDTPATTEPAAEADPFEEMTPPSTPEPSPPPDPPDLPKMTSEPETLFAPVEVPPVDVPPVDVPVPSVPPVEAPVVASAPEPLNPEPPVPAAPLDVTLPAPAPAASPAPDTPKPDGSDDDLVERIAQRVVDKLSSKVIQEIAWEVVPDLAEGLIQKEIDALKSKIPKSG